MAYQPDHLKTFQSDQRFEVSMGDSRSVMGSGTSVVRFAAGTTAGSRDLFVDEMTIDSSAGAAKASLRIDRNGTTVDKGQGAKTYKRGDAAPIDFVTLVDKPMFTFAFNENRVTVTNPSSAWKTLGSGASFDDVTTLFPDLPAQPVAAGFKWTITKQVHLPNNVGELSVAYELEYAGDSACPSGPSKTCAQILVRGQSNEAPVQASGAKATVSLACAGKIFFDVEQGVLDESRIHVAANLEVDGHDLEIDNTTSIKPIDRPDPSP